MSTIITILIIAIIAALVIVGLKETIKHSKGEGACCGGGAMKEDEEATVQLTGEIVTRADVHIDRQYEAIYSYRNELCGMLCQSGKGGL